ncbi:MAG: multidrug efflux SMR transporter [Paracoccus sp. (in: a-proteobacteria)]|nr:multidrug efflux SMR transporter [Paracoccus sp. (in: a-proteobacteria)]
MPGLLTYGILAAAIMAEIFATSMLQRSEQFTRLIPTLAMAVGYVLSFYLLSHVLRVIPLGVAYAIWSGLGVVCVALIGRFVFHQPIDAAGVAGISLIVAGVIVLNLFSGSATH